MGGHLSSTLGKAGLANLGLVTYSPKARQSKVNLPQDTFMAQDEAQSTTNPFMTNPVNFQLNQDDSKVSLDQQSNPISMMDDYNAMNQMQHAMQ